MIVFVSLIHWSQHTWSHTRFFLCHCCTCSRWEKSSSISFHSASIAIALVVLSVRRVCVWEYIICHVKTAFSLVYLPKVNGVTISDIYFTLNMKYVFLIIFLLTTFFAQLLHYTKGHCEKINGFLFWLAFLWLLSVLCGKAHFFVYSLMDITAIWNKLLFYAVVWVLYALLFLHALFLISLNTLQADRWVTMGHKVSYCLHGDWAAVAQ